MALEAAQGRIRLFWLAVKELDLSHHSMDILYMIWFLEYASLI